MKVCVSFILCLLVLHTTGQSVVLNVRDFGAIGDGKTNDQEAIQAAFDACGNSASITHCEVVIPTGRYLTASLTFATSNTQLTLEKTAVLDASSLGSDYLLTGPLPSYPITNHHNSDPRFMAVLSATSLENITITGGGRIDGHGKSFQKNASQENYQNPCVLEFLYCRNVLVRDIHIDDGAYYHIHPFASQNVTIDGVRIFGTAGNADGIDPDSCQDVLITNCEITTSDDCISMKSGKGQQGVEFGVPTTNVRIENNYFRAGAGVAIGSEMSGGISTVSIANNAFGAVANVVRFKSCPHYHGVVDNVAYVNNSLIGASTAIFVDMNYECTNLTNTSLSNPLFTDILVQNLHGDVLEAGSITCLPGACSNWTLRNVSFPINVIGYHPCENVDASRAIGCNPVPRCFSSD